MGCFLHFGIVTEAKPGYARVSFLEDDFVTGWLPIVMQGTQNNKQCYPLNVGEQVVCLMDINHEDGAILGATYNDNDTVPSGASNNLFVQSFEDGTVISYDTEAHKLTVNVQGDVVIVSSGKATVNAENVEVTAESLKITAPDIELNGAVNVLGTITAGGIAVSSANGGTGTMESDGDISTSGKITGGTVKQGLIELATHIHSGVTTGAGATGGPESV